MYSYMNRNTLKLLTALFAIIFFMGAVSATVSNLVVEGDPVNNTGIIYASGNTDGDDAFYFNISQGDGNDWTFAFDKNASADNSADSGSEFNFTVDLSDSSSEGVSYSDGPVNLSIAESVGGQVYSDLTDTPEDSVNFTQDSTLNSQPTISSTEPIGDGGINITFGDENSGDFAEIVSYEVHRSTSAGSGYTWIGNVTDTNATDYEFRDNGNLNSGTTYYYQIRPVDSAENRGTFSKYNSETSDGDGPSTSAKKPVPGTYSDDKSVEISFNLSDPNSIDSSSILLNVTDTDAEEELTNVGTGSSYVDFTDNKTTIDITSASFDYNPGPVDVELAVDDGLGNLKTESWSFTVDTSEPSAISVTDPIDGAKVTSQDTIKGSYDEDNEIDFVELQIQNSTGGYWTGVEFVDSENWVNSTDPVAWNYDSSSITSQDTYTVNVTATDKAGNTGTISSPISYTIDTGPPDFDIAYINDTDVDGVSNEIIVNFTESIDDSESNLSIAFVADKGDLDPVGTAGTVDDNQIRIPVSGLDTGIQPNLTMLNGTVKDAAGNNLSVNSSILVEDRARPVLMRARIDSENTSSGTTVVKMFFSENVSNTTAPADKLDLDVSGNLSINGNYSDILTANYTVSGSSEVLQTGNSPNITALGSVQDYRGNPAVLESNENITVSTFRKEFVSGWNFFSLPIADTSTVVIEDFFTQSQRNSIDTIWKYKNGEWSSYVPGKTSNDLTVMMGGEGYLVKTTSGFNLTPNVNNKIADSDGPTAPGAFDMDSGWNLVGQFQEFDQPADNTGSGAFASLGYDFSLRGQGEEGEVVPSGSPVEAEVGSAYWINPFVELNPQSDYVENN